MKLTPEIKEKIDTYFEHSDPQELYDKYCEMLKKHFPEGEEDLI